METKVTSKDVKDYLLSKAERCDANAHVWMSLAQSATESHSEVYPGLILGDYSLAKSPKKLKALGVTHVVNCACGSGFNQVNTDEECFRPSGIRFHGIPAKDIRQFSLTEYFNDAASFIDSALTSSGIVYVHCVAGVSRSATIVLAFLMLKRNMSLIEAVKTVRETRRILPNDGFLKELVQLNDELNVCKSS